MVAVNKQDCNWLSSASRLMKAEFDTITKFIKLAEIVRIVKIVIDKEMKKIDIKTLLIYEKSGWATLVYTVS
jgi:hypothetical protein